MKLTKIISAVFFGFSIAAGLFSYKALASEQVFHDRYFNSQWGLDNANDIDIDFPEVRAKYSGGQQETIVAVIDTGVDYTHEDLQGALWVNKGEIPENGIDDDGNGYIDDVHGWNFYDNNNVLYDGTEDMHGTHVTGIIAATMNSKGIAGVAGSSSVKVMVIKVMKDESGYTYNIINAIHYAEKMGAKICNLSFGTESTDKDLEEAIKNSKMLFVIAAGNGDAITSIGNDIDLKPMYPASYVYDNIISVANLQEDGKLHPSSNYSYTAVDIAAPGTKILSTIDSATYNILPNISAPYGYLKGTSMAAPFVTGTAALLYSDFPGITISQIRQSILNGTKTLQSLSGKVATGGMLSALGAYNYAYNNYQSFLFFNKQVEEANREEAKRLEEIKNEEEKKLEEAKIAEEERRKAEVKKQAESEKIEKQKKIKELKDSIKFYKTKTGKIRIKIEKKGIAIVRAVKGKKEVKYFEKGTKGYEIKLNKKNQVVLNLKKGIATFYVMDKQGNEVIKRVVVK
ncbi:MAG: S8 family peptidase [Catonella sp.]|uniref:S8 family peptidase n=1 Tax=Catonella sp. TaxID=2382125 RepID=UPI003FA165B7